MQHVVSIKNTTALSNAWLVCVSTIFLAIVVTLIFSQAQSSWDFLGKQGQSNFDETRLLFEEKSGILDCQQVAEFGPATEIGVMDPAIKTSREDAYAGTVILYLESQCR